VDGYSHMAIVRKEQDRKKEMKLMDLGWTLFRFSNKDILASIDTVTDKVESFCMTLPSEDIRLSA
jgi:very-short-patch-repair endonuclease